MLRLVVFAVCHSNASKYLPDLLRGFPVCACLITYSVDVMQPKAIQQLLKPVNDMQRYPILTAPGSKMGNLFFEVRCPVRKEGICAGDFPQVKRKLLNGFKPCSNVPG